MIVTADIYLSSILAPKYLFANMFNKVESMKITFRVDANRNIGMGHIMRCLSLADVFFSAGHRITFVLADETVEKNVNDRGYDSVVLNSDYKNMESELVYWPMVTQDIIIVDSYYVTFTYLVQLREKMQKVGGKLIYIDDVFSFPYPVDVLVNYNVYATKTIYDELYHSTKKPRLILGPTYAPLRSMFREIPRHIQSKKVSNILISTGGADELHLAISILQYVLDSRVIGRGENNTVTYHFLIGVMNTDREKICELARNVDNIALHENVTDMKSLICSSDLVISAAGSTLYEICACGVPFLTYSLADNQIPGAEAFEKLGLGINIGDLRDLSTINPNLIVSGKLKPKVPERILTETEKLAKNFEKRVFMGRRMQQLIDGFGADRLIEEILKTRLEHTEDASKR